MSDYSDILNQSVTHDALLRILCSEKGWDQVIESQGGRRISESEVDVGQRVCDYVIDDWRLFFELKTIEVSISENEKFRALIEKDEFEISEIENFLKSKIEKISKSANEQIKSTKLSFSKNSYQGALVIINPGSELINSSDAVKVIGRIYKNDQRLRSVNTIIWVSGIKEFVQDNLTISNHMVIHRQSAHKLTKVKIDAMMNTISENMNKLSRFSLSNFEEAAVNRYIDAGTLKNT